MKLLGIIALVGAAKGWIFEQECPHDLQIRCMDDVNKAYQICLKAEEEKGKDLPADLDCVKYITQTDKDCWPCICFFAEQQKWHIKGCK